MKKFLNLSDASKRQTLTALESLSHFKAQAIEKDIWVTNILQAVFSMPIKEHLVFKGGTSLSKAWNLIDRFSEDIDIAIDRSVLGAPDGSITKKQLKKLRKSSSLYVSEVFTPMLRAQLKEMELDKWLSVQVQPNGEGDGTYPEPRQIYIHYDTVFNSANEYLRSDVVLEIGARSLMEPVKPVRISSVLGKYIPIQNITDPEIFTAVPEKTFIEKIFLLHEIFSIEHRGINADRKSRHLYDLYQMMDKDFAEKAIQDDALWDSIRSHRELYTPISGFDYSSDIRRNLVLIPDETIFQVWRDDYAKMCETMIYGDKPSFDELIAAMSELQNKFK